MIKYVLLILVAGLLGYNSIYVRKLSDVKEAAPVSFDAATYVQKLWKKRLPKRLDSAAALSTVVNALHTQPDKAFAEYSNALGIGNLRYSMVKAAGRVLAVNEDDVSVLVPNGSTPVVVTLTTEYVYGNAVRDASGLVDVKDFVNTMDLNNISEELNRQVRKEVLPVFKATVQKQDSVVFTGAVELNREHLKLDVLNVIPVQIKIIPR